MPDPTADADDPYAEPDPSVLWRWVSKATRPWLGWVLIGAGALVILLGYLGVSRESVVAKQLPYLISGGIGGVLFCVLGAYVLGTEELRKDSGRLDRLEQMVEDLHAALLTRTDAPRPDAPPTARDDDTAETPRPRRARLTTKGT
ncbi:MAG: hypothetical protein M3Z03_10840 [Actinomycetota bacterium]|nr:hypothetical protein [Actinomycetota bacterium]